MKPQPQPHEFSADLFPTLDNEHRPKRFIACRTPPCFVHPGASLYCSASALELNHLSQRGFNRARPAAIRDAMTCINLAAASTALQDCASLLRFCQSKILSNRNTSTEAVLSKEFSAISNGKFSYIASFASCTIRWTVRPSRPFLAR